MDQPKNKGGRPPKPPSERLVERSVRLKPAHWERFIELGGHEWLRATLDATPAPLAKRIHKMPPSE